VLTDYSDFQLYGDQRPLTVTVPLPRTLSLYVIYGTRLVRIPVRRTYTLNPSYNPTRAQDEQAACGSWGDKLVDRLVHYFYLGVIALVVFTVLMILFVSWILKRSSR
jgi:hypothetical protein